MTRSWIITYVIIIFCLSGGERLYAQSALDPNCYEPTVGNGIDTYMKSHSLFGYYGAGVMLYPQNPLNDPNSYYITFPEQTAPYNFDIYRSPRPFELRGFSKYKQGQFRDLDKAIFGHFHSPKVLDVLFYSNNYPRPGKISIYWADDNGEYDTLRYTDLWSSVQGDYYPELGGGFEFTNEMNPYVAHLTSDSLDDIVFLGYTDWKTVQERDDSTNYYVLLYRGGQSLYHLDTVVYNDSVMYWGPTYDSNGVAIAYDRFGTAADLRGVGRKDLLASDFYGNMLYFKNDAPFSMQKFVDAQYNDTLLAAWQNPDLSPGDGEQRGRNRLTMRALPKKPGDSSVDFMPNFYTSNNYLSGSMWIYRGGKDFGTKRLIIDTIAIIDTELQKAEFIIRSPGIIDPSFAGVFPPTGGVDAGDMTGTGRPVLRSGVGYDHGAGWDTYYVLGDAIDEQIDIIVGYPLGGGTTPVPLDADGDKYGDVLYEADCCYDGSSLTPDSSGLWVLHGSPKIPVHLNAKYSVTTQDALDTSVSHILAYPNPFDEKTVLTFENCSGAPMTMQVANATGAICLSEEIPAVDGLQAYGADLSKLSAGMYFIRLACPSAHWSGTVSVVKTGAARSRM